MQRFKKKEFKRLFKEKRKNNSRLDNNSIKTKLELANNYNFLNSSYEINHEKKSSSTIDQYLYGIEGDNTYQFGTGFDVIDYSYLPESISLVRGGTVNKGVLGTDTFIDFYDKIIATNNSNDWIDGISNGGFIADLEINLSKGTLDINNLPGIGSISSSIEKFENISASNNSDNLIGNSSNNKILGNQGNDYIFGKRGKDNINGGDGNDVLKGGRGNDKLFGDAGEDLVEGGLGKDILNGGLGADTFIYRKANDSKLNNKKDINNVDWIKDFNTDEDKIYFSEAKEKQTVMNLGELDYLSAKSINKALEKNLCKNFNTIYFNVISSNKTFLAINGSGLGFQGGNDLLLDITGYTGELENINILSAGEFTNSNLVV